MVKRRRAIATVFGTKALLSLILVDRVVRNDDVVVICLFESRYPSPFIGGMTQLCETIPQYPHHWSNITYLSSTMRYCSLSAAGLVGTLFFDRVLATVLVEGSTTPVERQLQDSAVCDELKGEIQANTTTLDIQDSCQCSSDSDGNVRLACVRNDACLSSDGGDPMQGDFTATFTKDPNSLSYSQTITSETCFTYPTDVYEGKKVCVTYVNDGLGTVATCTIQVGSETCNVCRYCPIDLISFDCSNVGYEERTACGDNNTDDSILQFLYMPEIVDGCSGGSSSGGTSPSGFPTGMMPGSPTGSLSGGACMVNAMMATLFGLVPILLMG